jgi:hypothetical protein
MIDANYAKTVQNNMRKYNKKVSRGNDSIVKGNFVTVRIPTVDRASGNLPRRLSGHFIYSKNSSVIPRNSLFIGHASNPPYPY